MPLYDKEVCEAVAAEMRDRGRVTVAWEIEHTRLLQYMDRLFETAATAIEPNKSIHTGEYQLLSTLLSARVAAEGRREARRLVWWTFGLVVATAALVVVAIIQGG